jgi:competence protein ComEA
VSVPPPARAVFASSRSAQAALVAFVLCVVGLVAYHTYFPRLNAARPTDDPTSPAVTVAPKPVDLNTADRGELEQLPGVGPSMVDAILSHRREVGQFHSVNYLGAVPGVGDKTLAKLRPLLTVSEPQTEKLERKKADPPVVTSGGKIQPGEPPINVNTASEAELMRLPRVGPATARAIIAARPFRSVNELDRVKGIGPKTLDVLRPFVTVGE